MNKVGIATYHYVDNYGAVLQTYALYTIINRIHGFKSEIINFVPNLELYYPYKVGDEARNNLIEKRKKFEKFLVDNCNLSEKTLDTIDGNGLDCVCVGSDQVWNLTYGTSSHLQYLLPNVPDNIKKISYSSSVGMSVDIANSFRDIFEMYLPRFESLAVREHGHVDFISSCAKKECKWVVDPTLLLEKSDYETLIKDDRDTICDDKYILMLWLKEDNINVALSLTNAILRKYNFKVKHSYINAKPYTFYGDEGEYIYYNGIEEFLSLIKNAQCVITNSYHTSLLSIQFETPFYVYATENDKSRIDSIIEDYSIGNRVFDGYVEPDNISLEMNFSSIKDKIKEKRNESLDYLYKSLGVTR